MPASGKEGMCAPLFQDARRVEWDRLGGSQLERVVAVQVRMGCPMHKYDTRGEKFPRIHTS